MQINRDQTEYLSTIGKVYYFKKFLREKKDYMTGEEDGISCSMPAPP